MKHTPYQVQIEIWNSKSTQQRDNTISNQLVDFWLSDTDGESEMDFQSLSILLTHNSRLVDETHAF